MYMWGDAKEGGLKGGRMGGGGGGARGFAFFD